MGPRIYNNVRSLIIGDTFLQWSEIGLEIESAVEGITMYLGLGTIEYQHRSSSAMNMLHIPEMTTYTFTMTCFYFHLLLSIETLLFTYSLV